MKSKTLEIWTLAQNKPRQTEQDLEQPANTTAASYTSSAASPNQGMELIKSAALAAFRAGLQ